MSKETEAEKTAAAGSGTAPAGKSKNGVHVAPEPSEVERILRSAGIPPERVAALPAMVDLGTHPIDRDVSLDVARLTVRDGFAGNGTVVTELIEDHPLDGERMSFNFKAMPLFLGAGSPGDDMLRVKFRSDRPGGFDAKLVARIYWSDQTQSVCVTKIRAKATKATSKPPPTTSPVSREPLHEAEHGTEPTLRHEGEHATGSRPTPPAPPKWPLSLPKRIEFDDIPAGKTTVTSTHVLFDRPGQQGPRVAARVIGTDDVVLVSAPLFLIGSDKAPSNADAFKLRYHRTTAQPKGALEIEIIDNPQETYRIPFHVGVPEIAQDVVRDPKRDESERLQREGAAMEAAAQAAKGKLKGEARLHDGMTHLFTQARGGVERAMMFLTQGHLEGANLAEAEAAAFKRVPPNPNPSLIERLALPAIEVAFAAVAGGVGKHFEAALKLKGYGNEAMGVLVDGLKQIIKTAGKSIGDPAAPGSTSPPASPAVIREFFSAQRGIVRDVAEYRTTHLVETVANTLAPALVLKPGQTDASPDAERAVATLDAIASGLRAERGYADRVQKAESTRAWINYLAADHGRAHPVSAQDRKFDGLLDFSATGSQNFPANPVRIETVRMLGVGKYARGLMRVRKLEELGVPIRVVITLSDTPGRTVTILRSGAGQIQFEDKNNSGTTWFGRRSGNLRATEEQERRVAGQILEQLLYGRMLDDFAPTDKELEHDSVDD